MYKKVIFLLFLSLQLKGQDSFSLFQKQDCIYIVSKNDKSLWSICKRFNVSIENVKIKNNLKTFFIKEGDSLKIPTSQNSQKELILHTVKKEDQNLWNISKQYLVKIEDIIEINQKENDQIKIGETLIIPSLNSRFRKFKILNKGNFFSKTHSHIITKRLANEFGMALTPVFEIFTLKEGRYEKLLEITCFEEESLKLYDSNNDGFKDIVISKTNSPTKLQCVIYLYKPTLNNFSQAINTKNCP